MSGTIHLIFKSKKKIITNTSFYSYKYLPKKHNHVEIFFKNFRLIYNDPRRFGFFQIIDNKILLKKKFHHLGPEPFQQEFDIEYLLNFFNKKKRILKTFY
jgi:formamidopyrimidine-DNA glycosylase